MLTNDAPVATNSIKGNLTEIAGGNGYTAGGATATVSASAQSGGDYQLTVDDIVITASGGAIATFQYAVLYNDTPTSPVDPLIAWWDNGSAIDLANGESVTIDFDNVNGVYTMS
jgi:hypothetical protein